MCVWGGGGHCSVRDGYWVWVHEEGEGGLLVCRWGGEVLLILWSRQCGWGGCWCVSWLADGRWVDGLCVCGWGMWECWGWGWGSSGQISCPLSVGRGYCSHSDHRFPTPSSLKEGCRKPVLGVWVLLCGVEADCW